MTLSCSVTRTVPVNSQQSAYWRASWSILAALSGDCAVAREWKRTRRMARRSCGRMCVAPGGTKKCRYAAVEDSTRSSEGAVNLLALTNSEGQSSAEIDKRCAARNHQFTGEELQVKFSGGFS